MGEGVVMARAIPTSRQEVAMIKKLGTHMRSNPLHRQVATEGGNNREPTVRHKLYMEVATVNSMKHVPSEQQVDILQLGGTT